MSADIHSHAADGEEATRAANIYIYLYNTVLAIRTETPLRISLGVSLLSFFNSLLPASRVDKPALDGSNNHECNRRALEITHQQTVKMSR